MHRRTRIERRTAGLRAMARRAHRPPRLRRRDVGEAERERDRAIAHDIGLGVRRAGAVTRLATDLHGDRRPGRGLAGRMAAQTAWRGAGGEPFARPGVRRGLPGRELGRMTGPAGCATGPVAARRVCHGSAADREAEPEAEADPEHEAQTWGEPDAEIARSEEDHPRRTYLAFA